MELKDRLVSLRGGETQEDTAKQLGLELSLYQKMEDGYIPNKITVQSIADYYNVSVPYLFGKKQKKEE